MILVGIVPLLTNRLRWLEHIFYLWSSKVYVCVMFNGFMFWWQDVSHVKLDLIPVSFDARICASYVGKAPKTCGIGNVFSPDVLWIGLDTYMNCILIHDLLLKVWLMGMPLVYLYWQVGKGMAYGGLPFLDIGCAVPDVANIYLIWHA